MYACPEDNVPMDLLPGIIMMLTQNDQGLKKYTNVVFFYDPKVSVSLKKNSLTLYIVNRLFPDLSHVLPAPNWSSHDPGGDLRRPQECDWQPDQHFYAGECQPTPDAASVCSPQAQEVEFGLDWTHRSNCQKEDLIHKNRVFFYDLQTVFVRFLIIIIKINFIDIHIIHYI